MAVYGPVRHPKNVIWTSATEASVYTLRFYFPYLSLLAQPITIFVYGPVIYGPARYLHYFR
jgi:hypothetical protein